MGDFNINIKSSNCVKDKVGTFSDIAVNLSNNVILFIQKSVSNKSNKLTIHFFFFFLINKPLNFKLILTNETAIKLFRHFWKDIQKRFRPKVNTKLQKLIWIGFSFSNYTGSSSYPNQSYEWRFLGLKKHAPSNNKYCRWNHTPFMYRVF